MRDSFIFASLLLLSAVIFFFSIEKCTPNPEPTFIRITKTIPGIQGKSDTLYKDSIIYVDKLVPTATNDTLLMKYLQDSINRLNMYIEAITIRTYNQKFTDSVQEVSVYSKTRGELIEQQISYNIFPKTITFDTIIPMPTNNRSYFTSAGIRFGQGNTAAIIQGGYINKKNRVMTLGIGTDRQISATYGIKF